MIDLERLRARDASYFSELIQQFGPLVLTVARSFSMDADHAEDLYQEIWTHVYRKCRSFDGRGSFEAWLHRLATNVCRTEYRQRRAGADAIDRFVGRGASSDWGWTPPDPLEQVEREQLRRSLHRALGRLSEREHEAILLRMLDGRSPEEVADAMGVKKATVRSLTRHAITRLKSIMEDPGDDLPRQQSNH